MHFQGQQRIRLPPSDRRKSPLYEQGSDGTGDVWQGRGVGGTEVEVGGEVHGDICGRRLRRRRLREKKSWRDRGVRGMEGEGGSKYMKMVVRETIAWATLEKGGTFQSPNSHKRKAFNNNNNQPSRPTKSIT